MIISLHIPKTGGASFRELLQQHFKNGYRDDYADQPMSKPVGERNSQAEMARKEIGICGEHSPWLQGAQCIHGHFLPYKYEYFHKSKDVAFVTWLREPLERFASHYHYWRRTYHEGVSNPFHKRVVEENWSFEDFCFSTHFQNFYTSYLWNFPISNFDFIGITEHYESDMTWFATQFLNAGQLEIAQKNVNPNKSDLQEELRSRFKKFHSIDYEIYEYAMKRRRETRLYVSLNNKQLSK